MAEVPPRDVWMVGTTGLTRWRPEFDLIEVHRGTNGKVLRLCLAGIDHQIVLDRNQANHLAALLMAAP